MRSVGWGRRIVAGVLALVALACVALAVAAGLQALQFDTAAVEVDAIVVRLASANGDNGALAPVFAFRLPGQDHVSEARGYTATLPPSYTEGERTTIRVDPANPQQAYGPKESGPWIWIEISGTLGIMAALASYRVATLKPSGRQRGRRFAVVVLDVLTSFMVFGTLIGAATGGLTGMSFDLQGVPVFAVFACVIAYLVLGRRLPGGTMWQRILRTKTRTQAGRPGPT